MIASPPALAQRFARDVLDIDQEAVVAESIGAIRHQGGRVLRRRGAVVGLSGGVDSGSNVFVVFAIAWA